ncbi:MAG: ferritin family protein [Candidatus Zapsychrus exili]|nr:ferritin family protein [Candidatus Zapsychrus exili]
MSDQFSGSEIIEIGIQIEINGKEFYETLVDNIEDEEAKKVFKFLASEEESHIYVFQKILDLFKKYEPIQSYPEEYFAHMNSLASEHAFTKKGSGRQIALGVEGYAQAIDLGIGFEKDSIVFFDNVKKLVSEQDHQMIDKLIAQEYEHLKKLEELKDAI